jgi:hypothetical protein
MVEELTIDAVSEKFTSLGLSESMMIRLIHVDLDAMDVPTHADDGTPLTASGRVFRLRQTFERMRQWIQQYQGMPESKLHALRARHAPRKAG